MSDIAVRVDGLSKQYRIGGLQGKFRYRTIRDALVEAAQAPFVKAARLLRGEAYGAAGLQETIWALKDVSFEVNEGEAVGIIGRNGAGKSTLLKILSRITEPTEGVVDLYGRVGSLLEVGTGFHPELTGRENVYLNGAILGMRRAEIDHKFDEIVAFSELEKFIDTPVKHYSSGMYVRLAFSVAAHLQPEILVVDEVLAVGDAAFQKKCMGKMEATASEGRTVLFVSHNMTAIGTLCSRAIYLSEGRIVFSGPSRAAIGQYLSQDVVKSLEVDFRDTEVKDSVARLLRVRFVDRNLTTADWLAVDKEFGIEITYQIMGKGYRPTPNILISTEGGVKAFQSLETRANLALEKGTYGSIVWIPAHLLNDGSFVLTAAITTPNPVHIHCQAEIAFEVEDRLDDITRGDYKQQMHGVVRPYLTWETLRLSG
jgi:lipopolysaccharide transport system ATP-binding protein